MCYPRDSKALHHTFLLVYSCAILVDYYMFRPALDALSLRPHVTSIYTIGVRVTVTEVHVP